MNQIQPPVQSPNSSARSGFGWVGKGILLGLGFAAGYLWQPAPASDPRLARLAEAESALIQAEKQLAQRDVELQIERHALAEMDKTIKQQQSELLEQQGELRFYQKIMAPENTANGVVIDDMLLENGISPGHYRFELVLAQLKRRKQFTRGRAMIELIGSQQQKPATFNLGVLGNSDKQQKFSFRYFQAIKGEFFLPHQFVPEKIKITLDMPKHRGQVKARLVEELNWTEVLQEKVLPLLHPAESESPADTLPEQAPDAATDEPGGSQDPE